MPSDKYRTVVKRQHIRHREVRIILGLVAIGLLMGAGFLLGNRDVVGTPVEVSLSGTELLRELRNENEAQRVQHDLDVATLEMIRKEIASQKEQISQLEEGLLFYKSLMAPEAIAQGLSLRKIELVATEASDRFIFRLVAQQESRKHPLLKGSLSVELFGLLDGEEALYPLAEISDDIDGDTVSLRFRYFQAVEGELVIPEGFEPQGFRVVAKLSAPKKAEVREQFPWEVQERFTYVGK